MKIGIDFGSTYSVISKYNSTTDNVTAMTLGQSAPACIPSAVCLSQRGEFTCGTTAKGQAHKKNVRFFEAFKMLLTEADHNVLRSRGYDEVYTPRRIAKEYLQSVLRGLMKREGAERIENVVICVPEIWNSKINMQDGRAILRDVLKNDVDIDINHDGIRVVTEPEAASAFIAYNYEKEAQKKFNGHLLLIDYGGGTLDLTLTKVSSMGNGSMEISYREGGGAGENHRDERGGVTIGKAGIAYMQGVIARALCEQGLVESPENIDYTNPGFIAAVRNLEMLLMDPDHINNIEEIFGEFGTYRKIKKILDDETMYFDEVDYGGETVTITYQHLFKAYQEIIEDVLHDELCKINKLVQKHIGEDPCKPAAGSQDNFKIAMVGGFSNFYLVKKQIAEIYNLNANSALDLRMKNVSADKQEQAISLGAALLAAGKVVQKKTARWSIGIYSSGGGDAVLSYGIKYHQTVESNKPYFLCRNPQAEDKPSNRIGYAMLAGNIKTFAIEYSDNMRHGNLMNLKEEMVRRLEQVPDDGVWHLGFSFDESDVVSFHLVPKGYDGLDHSDEGIVIPLDSFNKMFDLTAVEEVTV